MFQRMMIFKLIFGRTSSLNLTTLCSIDVAKKSQIRILEIPVIVLHDCCFVNGIKRLVFENKIFGISYSFYAIFSSFFFLLLHDVVAVDDVFFAVVGYDYDCYDCDVPRHD